MPGKAAYPLIPSLRVGRKSQQMRFLRLQLPKGPTRSLKKMVYISKVYTRFGDKGDTMLADGSTVRKSSPRVNTYGNVDELNATVGLVRLELNRESTDPSNEQNAFTASLDQQLARIQQELFNLGAELSTPISSNDEVSEKLKLRIDEKHVIALETEIDVLNDQFEPLKSFILPGGGPTATAAHLARTVCRRSERSVTELAANEYVRPEATRYLNRLSDYLFVVSRAAALHFGHPEVLWDQENT